MNKSIALLMVVAALAVAFSVASATIIASSRTVGYQPVSYQPAVAYTSYQPAISPYYQSYSPLYSYSSPYYQPYYRGYSASIGVGAAPVYNSYGYGPAYYSAYRA